MLPLVSVIVLTYRHAAFIEDCLSGILAQEGPFEMEIVVSDDASDDDTAKILRQMALEQSRIHLFVQEENLGPARNFEFALKHCRGNFVGYCEGDDIWVSPRKLSVQLAALQRDRDANLVYSQYGKIDAGGDVLEAKAAMSDVDMFQLDDLVEEHGPAMNSVMFRRSALAQRFPAPFFTVPNPDVFILAAALLGSHGIFVPGVFSMYRTHRGGIWSSVAPLEKRLIRYVTLAKVFGTLPGDHSKTRGRVYDRMEKVLIVARRRDGTLFKKYRGALPTKRRMILCVKWLYARWIGSQQLVD